MPKRIVVPVDLSEGSARALVEARTVGGPDAELMMLFVTQEEGGPPGRLGSLRDELEDFARAHGAVLSRIDVRTTRGNEAIEIARHAEHVGADLLVIASHGRTGLARVHVGSVAERVVRYCNCPVLVIKTKTNPL